MIQTNTEYMSDLARVDRVIQRFLNIPLKELKGINDKHIKFITDEIIPRENISEEKIQNMQYIEFACLIDHVGGNPNYDWFDHDSYAERQFYYICIACSLLKQRKYSIPIKLFMEIPLQAFYIYLHGVSGKSMLDEFDYMVKACSNYSESYTIREFLSEKVDETNKEWKPIVPLGEYANKIRTAYSDIGRLLVDSFRMAFPDRFDVKNICDKYRDNAYREDCLFNDTFEDFFKEFEEDDGFETEEDDDGSEEYKSETTIKDNISRKEDN